MPTNLLALKTPSIASISTALTYGALTGVLMLPALSSPLPAPIPIMEAAAPSTSDVTIVRTRTVEIPQQVASLDPTSADPQSSHAVDEAAAKVDEVQTVTPEQIDTPSVQGTADEVLEAKARVKSARQPSPKKLRTKEIDAAKESKTKASDGDHEPATQHDKDPDKGEAHEEPKSGEQIPVDSKEPALPATWSDAEIADALKECLRLVAPIAVEIEPNPAVRHGQCGTPAPILLKSVGTNPKIVLRPAAEVNCQMVVGLDEWAKTTLQPAARETLGSEVTQMVSTSGYSCRNRYGRPDERLSEHALANAIDIGGFTLANGKTVRLTSDWGRTARDKIAQAKAKTDEKKEDEDAKKNALKSIPVIKGEKSATKASLKGEDLRKATRERAEDKKKKQDAENDAASSADDVALSKEGRFLRQLHDGACKTFGTVLGPEANDAHRDHFHFDMKPRKRRAVCQ